MKIFAGGASVDVDGTEAWLVEAPCIPKTEVGGFTPNTDVEDDGNAEAPKGEGVLKTLGVAAIVEKAETGGFGRDCCGFGAE